MAPRLIADIGGTNARFALARPDGGISDVAVLPVAGYPDFAPALDDYLGQIGGGPPGAVAIAAAGPRDGDAVTLTNAPWRIEADAVSARLGGTPVLVLNDLEAVALCLPGLGPADLEVLAEGAPAAPRLPMLAANVGTGFGAAVAVPMRSRWSVLGTEAGHMSLVAATPAEAALLSGAGTVEEAFSGPGYARLFGTPTRDGGEGVRPDGPGTEDRDSGRLAADRAVYSAIFGRVLGDLALATGAWGGVFLCGGVTSDLARVVDVETMLRAFCGTGKMAGRLARVPVCRITLDAPAFRALAAIELDV